MKCKYFGHRFVYIKEFRKLGWYEECKCKVCGNAPWDVVLKWNDTLKSNWSEYAYLNKPTFKKWFNQLAQSS